MNELLQQLLQALASGWEQALPALETAFGWSLAHVRARALAPLLGFVWFGLCCLVGLSAPLQHGWWRPEVTEPTEHGWTRTVRQEGPSPSTWVFVAGLCLGVIGAPVVTNCLPHLLAPEWPALRQLMAAGGLG